MDDRAYGFVVMPFGEKTDVNGDRINFDDIYAGLIRPALEKAGLQALRCDEIGEAGWIHIDMFRHLLEAPVAVVDISTLNPNVLYELGVRHALKECVTVLIRRAGTHIPFNLSGFRVMEYASDAKSWENARRELSDFIQAGTRSHSIDSPIHQVLPDLRVKQATTGIPQPDSLLFHHPQIKGARLGIKTGDIKEVKGVDVWVNSENTNMQPARYFDTSISGLIRYLAADLDFSGHVEKDVIGEALRELLGNRNSVMPGAVLPTPAGRMATTHQVKWVFHAASVVGQVGAGYHPIQDLGACVTNALTLMDAPRVASQGPLFSILFPLLGAGDARGELREVVRKLLQAAHNHLLQLEPEKQRQVFFLAYTEQELDACLAALRKLGWKELSKTPGT
jgi:O-acetyl-ADP-ribose deacetylase (regulator of RNase III)